MIFPGIEMRIIGLQFPFLNTGVMFSFFQSPWTLSDSHDFSNMMGSSLATTSASSFRTLGCTYRLVRIQSHEMISNLLCFYSGRDFAPTAPIQSFRDMRDIESLTASEDRGIGLVECPSLFHVYCCHFSLVIYQRGHAILGLSLLINVPVESLVIFHILCHIQFHLHLRLS